MNDLNNISLNDIPLAYIDNNTIFDETKPLNTEELNQFIKYLIDSKTNSSILSENNVKSLLAWSKYIKYIVEHIYDNRNLLIFYNTLVNLIKVEFHKRDLTPIDIHLNDLFNLEDVLFELWIDNNQIDEEHLHYFITMIITLNNNISDRVFNKIMSLSNLNNSKKVLIESYKQIKKINNNNSSNDTNISINSRNSNYIDILENSYHCERKACAILVLEKLNKEPLNNSTKQTEILSELLKKESNYNLFLWILYISVTNPPISTIPPTTSPTTAPTANLVNSKLLLDILKKDNKIRAQFNLGCDDIVIKSLASIDKSFFEFHVQTLFTVFEHYCFKFSSPNIERVNLLTAKFKSLQSLCNLNQEINNTLSTRLQALITKSKSTKLLNPDVFKSILNIYNLKLE